ncbi:MAG: UDP-N-acetylmuramate--L-alanine ligase [Bacteroidales bacterium]|nr:UDP-N-acetylmuramate--L-alanine ligase [Bacteroidales bacterium]
MNIKNINSVYFVGIGGIGMSAIARYFKSLGKYIVGYDRTDTELTKQLIKENIDIHFNDNVDFIPEYFKEEKNKNEIMVIYTPAIPDNSSELNFFMKNDYRIYKRSEILGIISKNSRGIAVAGTHGKTTISSMIAHLLKQSSVDCTAFLGGILNNYNTNLLLSDKSDIIVLEADEFDKSFLKLHPYFAVITSVDADHLDIYGNKNELNKTFEQFISQIQDGGKLLIKKNLDINYSTNDNIKTYTYSLNDKADFYAQNIKLINGLYTIDLITPFGNIKNIEIGLPGRINVENAVAAIAVALLSGVKEIEIINAAKSFKGVKRRFDLKIISDNLIFIDDYAHHPEEIKACINSVKEMFPDKKITGVFQPHLYSRTYDFADEFATSLNLLDDLILLDIYPAREKPVKGVSSKLIYDKININNKSLCSKNSILNILEKKDIEVLITMGAGDIDQLIEPIMKLLNKNLTDTN